jgi:integrase/recombinase XerD
MTFLDLYEKHLYSRRLVPNSVHYIRARLLHFAHWLAQERGKSDARDVTLQDVLDFHVMLRGKKRKLTGELISAGYCNAHLYCLRGYYQFLYQTGRILIDPCADLPELRSPRALPKGVLTASQAMRLLQQPNVLTLFGFRDRVILELLYSTGLRGLEVCRLSIYDIDFDDGTVIVRKGKGGKDRVVPMGKVAAQYVREYLTNVRPRMMAKMPHPEAAERLFFSQRRRPLHPQMLYYLVRQNRKKADLPMSTSTHSLRHTCATEMLRGGASIRHVQEMLGHSQITTTQVYTRVVPSDLQKVHKKTSPSERLKKIEAPTFKFNGMWCDSTPHGPRKRRRKRRASRSTRA